MAMTPGDRRVLPGIWRKLGELLLELLEARARRYVEIPRSQGKHAGKQAGSVK